MQMFEDLDGLGVSRLLWEDHQQPHQPVGAVRGDPLQPPRLGSPPDKQEVDWHRGEDHQEADAGLYWAGYHGQQRDHQGHAQVDDGEDQVDFDWSGKLWMFPPEVRETGYSDSNGEPL